MTSAPPPRSRLRHRPLSGLPTPPCPPRSTHDSPRSTHGHGDRASCTGAPRPRPSITHTDLRPETTVLRSQSSALSPPGAAHRTGSAVGKAHVPALVLSPSGAVPAALRAQAPGDPSPPRFVHRAGVHDSPRILRTGVKVAGSALCAPLPQVVACRGALSAVGGAAGTGPGLVRNWSGTGTDHLSGPVPRAWSATSSLLSASRPEEQVEADDEDRPSGSWSETTEQRTTELRGSDLGR